MIFTQLEIVSHSTKMFSMKVAFLLCFVLTVVSAQRGFGAPSTLSGEGLASAENTLRESLSKLASGTGPHYRLGRIISASHQVVSGDKYTYDVELIGGGSTKTCHVEIWSQSWLPNGNQVTFDCPDGRVVARHD